MLLMEVKWPDCVSRSSRWLQRGEWTIEGKRKWGQTHQEQNSDLSPKGVHVLIPRNCEYVNYMAEKN